MWSPVCRPWLNPPVFRWRVHWQTPEPAKRRWRESSLPIHRPRKHSWRWRSDPRLRLVFDETNLAGDYDIVLDYSVDAASGPTQDATASAMMDAVQDLGLKLVPRKTAVEIIVVDHAERPAAN